MTEPVQMELFIPREGEDLFDWLAGRRIGFVSTAEADDEALPYIQFELEGGHTLRIYTNPSITMEWFVGDEDRTEPHTPKSIQGAVTDGV
jgi:hypothetical protein